VDKHYFKIELQTQLEERKVEDIVEDVVDEDNEDVEVENAPPLLELTDEEKFKDINGNIIDIETRGEKHRNKIYFKVKDVSVAFGMDGLNTILLHKDRGYVYNDDYKRFNREIRLINDQHKTTNKKKKCRLYLTYHGLLRVLFVSYNKNAEPMSPFDFSIILSRIISNIGVVVYFNICCFIISSVGRRIIVENVCARNFVWRRLRFSQQNQKREER
jgi:hypothetical protein